MTDMLSTFLADAESIAAPTVSFQPHLPDRFAVRTSQPSTMSEGRDIVGVWLDPSAFPTAQYGGGGRSHTAYLQGKRAGGSPLVLVLWGTSEDDTATEIQSLEVDPLIAIRTEVATRLRELRDQYQDEHDSADIAASTVRGLRTFLSKNPFLARPAISLTDAGTIYARWKGSPTEVFSVLFNSDNDAEYVVIAPQLLGGQPKSGKATPANVGVAAKITLLPWVRA